MKSVPKSRIACNSALLWFFGISSTIFTNSFVTVKKETTKKLFTEFSFKYTSQVLKFFFFYITRIQSSWLKSHYHFLLFGIPWLCPYCVQSKTASFWTKGKTKLLFSVARQLLCWSGGASWPPASACRLLPPVPS